MYITVANFYHVERQTQRETDRARELLYCNVTQGLLSTNLDPRARMYRKLSIIRNDKMISARTEHY